MDEPLAKDRMVIFIEGPLMTGAKPNGSVRPAIGTCMRFTQRRSPRWWAPYYLKRSSLSSRDFGIFSDPALRARRGLGCGAG